MPTKKKLHVTQLRNFSLTNHYMDIHAQNFISINNI